MQASGDSQGREELVRLYEENGYEVAMSWLADRSAAHSTSTGTLGWWVAYRYAHAGQDEEAIKWLERAYQHRDPSLPFFRLPEFEKLHSDPRIRQLMQRVGVL